MFSTLEARTRFLANLFQRPITYYLRQAHLLVTILDSTKAEHGTLKFLEAFYPTTEYLNIIYMLPWARANISLLLYLIHLNSSTSELVYRSSELSDLVS